MLGIAVVYLLAVERMIKYLIRIIKKVDVSTIPSSRILLGYQLPSEMILLNSGKRLIVLYPVIKYSVSD